MEGSSDHVPPTIGLIGDETSVGDDTEEGPSGYYMDSGGMLVCGGQDGADGFGEDDQVAAAGGVHQMRRDLSGEAFEWVPQSQSSDEALSQHAPQAYEQQAYEQQAYAGGFGGSTFGSGAWGSAGAGGAADEGGEASADSWGDDAIVLEPAHPFDEWNFGGTVAVHTRCAPQMRDLSRTVGWPTGGPQLPSARRPVKSR